MLGFHVQASELLAQSFIRVRGFSELGLLVIRMTGS